MTQAGYCQDFETKKADLPTGGQFVTNPKGKEMYYFVNKAMMWEDKSNAQKHSGLYRSDDGGQIWKLICEYFEFKDLFIHPVTGKLFAIIEDTWLADADTGGYLVPHFSDKAISSSDGRHWTDIMGKQGHAGTLLGIFQDLDHPDRVCLETIVIRDCVLQSKDENYSDWSLMRAQDWTAQHPGEKYFSERKWIVVEDWPPKRLPKETSDGAKLEDAKK